MQQPPLELKGLIAVVTGSSSGIGRAIAQAYAAAGAAVVITATALERAERTAAEICRAGGDAVGRSLDVTERASLDALVSLVLERYGHIDILVNNAGVFPRARVTDMREGQWEYTIDVNLTGVFRLTQAMLPHIRRPGGRIVNITSGLAIAGCYGGSAYAASKAGVIAFTRSLAHELAFDGVNVNAISPGLMDTALARGAFSEEEISRVARSMPAGRLGQPEDVAGTALYLVSKASAHVTGQVIFLKSPVPVLAPVPSHPGGSPVPTQPEGVLT